MTRKNDNFGTRLRGLLEESGTSQAEFCRTFGLKPARLTHYLKGRIPGDMKLLESWAAYFETSIDWMLTGKHPAELAQQVSEHPARYGPTEPLDRFYIELGRAIEDLKPAADREVLRQHQFMILRPHIDVDKIWKRYKQIREDLDRKPNTRE